MTDNPMLAEDKPGTPAAEVEIDLALVRALLAEQHHDLAHLPLTLADTGWDNVMVRIGQDFAARLPRRIAAVTLLGNERRWLPRLAPGLPLAISAPLRHGRPGCGYPWDWSILPWLPGEPADVAEPCAGQGEMLAQFLRALHQPAPADAPYNPVRSIPLADRQAAVEARMHRLEKMSAAVTPQVWALWSAAVAAPVDLAPTWIHGDLHARNVLVEDGRFNAIIDWGDMAQGDPATDLAGLWALLPDAAERRGALHAYGPVSPATLTRARGWAVLFGVMLLESGLIDHPRHARMGELTLQRVTGDYFI